MRTALSIIFACGGIAGPAFATNAKAQNAQSDQETPSLESGAPAAAAEVPAPQPSSLESAANEPPPDEPTRANEPRLRYFFERVEVHGNTRTSSRIIRSYVPLAHGEAFDPESPQIEAIEWKLLGTGWFREVQISLKRGSQRGWVVLQVHVRERNTIVVNQLVLGVSEGLNNSEENARVRPYGGFSIAENNLLGLGIGMSLQTLLSRPQQGVRVGYTDPSFLRSPFALRASGFFNNARQFFGTDPLVSIRCPEELLPNDCPAEVAEANSAVVFYRRGGVSLGTAREVGASTRYTLDWRGEAINVRARPEAASETRGTEVRPIDFSIEDGRSYISLVRFGVTFDRRDHPVLPSRGLLVRFRGDGATRVIGSSYDFLRVQGLGRFWVPLPRRHSLRFSGFAGVLFGEAPFFYKFHVSDLTDLIPSRVLEMELDRRPAPNLFNTSIETMRNEELAFRLDVQYNLPLYRSKRGLRALNAYFNAGVYMLADLQDVRVSVPGYQGLSKVPVDFTFDVGLRADTSIGVFQFGFSTILGFIRL